MLHVLPPTNQACLETNLVVAGCEKFLQKVESSSVYFFPQNLYMVRVLPAQGKLVLQQVT